MADIQIDWYQKWPSKSLWKMIKNSTSSIKMTGSSDQTNLVIIKMTVCWPYLTFYQLYPRIGGYFSNYLISEMEFKPCLFFRQEKKYFRGLKNDNFEKSIVISWQPILEMKIAEFEEVKRIKVSERSRLFLY